MSSLKQSGVLLVLNAVVVAAVAIWANTLWPAPGLGAGAGDTHAAPIQALPNVRPVANDAIAARPLFAPSRRAAPAAPLPAAKRVAPASPSAPSLLGVVGEDTRLGALFVDEAGRRSHLVWPGEAFAGWTLVSVGSRVVRIRSGASIVDLPLRQAGSSQGGAVSGSGENGR